MAKDSIQTKYLEGEGSPEGVVKGKVGFTYKDLLTEDEYISLGGDKWRKEANKNIPIITRNITNILDDNELGDTSIGEIIYDENSKNDFKVIKNKPLNFIVQERIDSTLFSQYIMKDISNNGTDIFDIGSEIKYKFQVESLADTGLSNLIFGFNDHRNSVQIIRKSPIRDGIYSLTPFQSDTITFTVKDLENNIVDSNNLIFKKWYEIEVVFLEAVTVRGSGSDVDNSRGINIIRNLQIGSKINFADIEIRGEKFNIDIDQKTIIGDRGSIFYRRPESTLESEFSKVEKGKFDGSLFFTEKNIYSINPINNIITPQMLGYVCSKELDFTNDASDILQACFDSPYEVFIPAGLYYISKTVFIRKQKQYKLSGFTYPNTVGNNPSAIQDVSQAKFLTWIYTDKNINMFDVQTSRVVFTGGLIDTSYIPLHDKCAIRLDLNYKVAYCRFERIVIQGDKDTLFITGKGTKGIHTDLNVNEGGDGHAYYNTFKDIFGLYLNTVVSISEPGEHWEDPNFINTYTVDIQGDGCKAFVELKSGGTNKVTAETQDRRILNDEENALAPFYISGKNNIIDVFCYDQNLGGQSGTAPHRHNLTHIYAPYSSNILTGRSLSTSHPTLLRRDDVNGVNHRVLLNNPPNAYLGDNNLNLISSLNSAIRYSNDYGNVTYKGYLAPNENWFDENLYESDSLENPAPIVEDNINGCITTGVEFLLSSNLDTVEGHTNHLIFNESLGFAEVHIKLPLAEDLRRLVITLNTPKSVTIEKIQVIQKLDNGQIKTKYYKNISVGAYNISPLDTKGSTSELIIRIIGRNGGDATTKIEIKDISAIQKNAPLPVLNIGKTTQVKLGQLHSIGGYGDNFMLGSKHSKIIEVSKDLLVSNGEGIDLYDMNSHILFNNITSGTRIVEFNNRGNNYTDITGVEYFIRNSGKIGGTSSSLYPESEKIELRSISTEAIKFVFKDKSESVILNANDWIKLKVIDLGSPSRSRKILVETERSTNLYEDILTATSIKTEDTGSNISLATTGGNFCNMENASTVQTFTTTGNILGAWAEILINRIDQPSITGATYKSSKGVPFVASTDMIMRVENKGVPRGVQYWFEEI